MTSASARTAPTSTTHHTAATTNLASTKAGLPTGSANMFFAVCSEYSRPKTNATMNDSSSVPPIPTMSVSSEKNAGHVAVSPERFALVPSSPSCAARPGSRTIHMNSAIASGPIEIAARENHVTFERRSLTNSVKMT